MNRQIDSYQKKLAVAEEANVALKRAIEDEKSDQKRVKVLRKHKAQEIR
jgi:hypothetical protein